MTRDFVAIAACDPASPAARAMSDALWDEIQRRYGFTAASPFDPAAFAGPVGGFWLATVAAGFRPIPPFGRRVGDESARCLEKPVG